MARAKRINFEKFIIRDKENGGESSTEGNSSTEQKPPEQSNTSDNSNSSNVPSTPDEYDLGDTDDEKLKVFQSNIKNIFHSAKLSKEQAKLVSDKFNEMQSADLIEFEKLKKQNKENSTAKLKEMWGQDYESKINTTNETVKKLGGENVFKLLEESGLLDDYDFRSMFDKLSAVYQEGEFVTSNGGKRSEPETFETLDAKIEELLSNKEFKEAYYDSMHPNHDNCVKRINNLYTKQAAFI